MTSVGVEDLAIVAVVALLHMFQLASDAQMVGEFRKKFKISPPEMNGPPEFQRAIRAQANNLEWALIIEMLMWICGIFVHPELSAVLGLVYIYGRYKYTKGYLKEAEQRRPGFYVTVQVLKAYLILCIAGLVNASLKKYADINLPKLAMRQYYGR